eukprot:CAMPEP_0206218702 /NCGR_PEP_ID=MMETSP0047_2-20121206/3935_1 /ASSEMBLY_ACC=CAM_ASM_000192 /TAXON_ID=195065 /ORGANISM="Chroomonas mesostigmatica_cf, Strain CCMP1168" /LENGTH=765 /DNA_ID=CAMNT_0053641213 /DNA_START=166 /DNA_END=2460 /DNA_ORIENTATION=+
MALQRGRPRASLARTPYLFMIPLVFIVAAFPFLAGVHMAEIKSHLRDRYLQIKANAMARLRSKPPDRAYSTLRSFAEKAAGPENRVILTGAWSGERDLLVNFLVHMEMTKNFNNTVVLSYDQPLVPFLTERGVAAFDASANLHAHRTKRRPKHEALAEKLRAQLSLLRAGHDVMWADPDVVLLIDRERLWEEFDARKDAHVVAQRSSGAKGTRGICTGLMLIRSSNKTADIVEGVLERVLSGEDETEVWNDALKFGKPVYVASGTDKDKELQAAEIRPSEFGDRLVVGLLPYPHFPLKSESDTSDLTRWSYIWHDASSAAGNATALRVKHHMMMHKMWFVREGYAELPAKSNFGDWACSALPEQLPTRIVQARLVEECKERSEEKELDEELDFDGWEDGGDAKKEFHHGLNASGFANSVVMLLSQGRSGSTVSGALVLEKHPYCGMYIDELVWLVYRNGIAKETDADQLTAVDFFLNASQCDMDHEIWRDEEGLAKWLEKRNKYAHGEAGTHQKEDHFYSKESQHAVCRALRARTHHKAVCSKEIRFLGHVKQLLQRSVERQIPFTLLYLLRDPRATVMSQMWVFSSFRHSKGRDESDQSADMLRSHCRIAASDMKDINSAPEGPIVRQVCFEALNERPQETLSNLYSNTPGFSNWPGKSIIPPSVRKYGKGHMAYWNSSTKTIPSRPLDSTGMWYKGTIISHRYSADISRALHIDEWKTVILQPKHKKMREVWDTDEQCMALRQTSQCAKHWPVVWEPKGAGGE